MGFVGDDDGRQTDGLRRRGVQEPRGKWIAVIAPDETRVERFRLKIARWGHARTGLDRERVGVVH